MGAAFSARLQTDFAREDGAARLGYETAQQYLRVAKTCNVTTPVPIRFRWFIVAYVPRQGCERKSWPAVLTRTVKQHQRLSSLRESEKEARKRNKKLSTQLGKIRLATNSKQFSWTKTSL